MNNRVIKPVSALIMSAVLMVSTVMTDIIPIYAEELDQNCEIISEETDFNDAAPANDSIIIDDNEPSEEPIGIQETSKDDPAIVNGTTESYMFIQGNSEVDEYPIVISAQGNADISDSAEPDMTSSDETITQLAPFKFNDATAEGDIEPFSNHYLLMDGSATINADLSNNKKLVYSLSISDSAQFSTLPADVRKNEVIEWGKNPGLGVDVLHKHGLNGAGATIAYIDMAIDPKHEEFKNLNLHYTDNTPGSGSAHGPAVLSLLAGKTCGTAPGAEVYYYSQPNKLEHQLGLAECLYQIIEQNKKLPDDKKIRMVGLSNNIVDARPYADELRAATKACEDSGVMVWWCANYAPIYCAPESDRNNPDNYYCEEWYAGAGVKYWSPNTCKLVAIPTAAKTTASTALRVESASKYIYWGEGGLSWAMPYALGIYADALAIDPTLTKEDIESLIVSTATTLNANNVAKVINPVEFIATILERVGRYEDAESLRLDYKKSFHYLYALMDKSKMTTEDITAVEEYLRTIKGVTVLEVDTSSIKSSDLLYSLLKDDAATRGGIVDGVQIFGLPSDVPSFDIRYLAQYISNSSTGEYSLDGDDYNYRLLTDLFYGNFNNDVNDIGYNYNVYDQFSNNKNIALTPEWPVVRLTLESGQYAEFFEKYNNYASQTQYNRVPIVNFSNPIFKQKNHSDDMGEFLDRAKSEFKILGKNDYRLYGNQLGQYPVTTKVLGGFTAENLTKENQAGISEFLINSHGQWNNIDKCWFENEEEKRESLINSSTINTVLSANPYYLDCWTCSNAYEMLSDGLAVTALRGNSIGVFACTTVISNNGVNCHASMDMLKHCNFYWFYYNYLSSLNAGNTRARAFYDAQVAYANSLIADSAEGIGIANGQRIMGNYQFNLYNLLGYHNFGVMEPWTVTGNNSYNNPSGGSSTPGSTIKPVALPDNIVVSQKADIKALTGKSYGKYTVEPKENGSITSKGLLTAKKPGLLTITGYIKDGKNWVADAVYTISVEQPSTRYFTLGIQEIGETVNLAQEVLVCLTVTPTWSSSNPKIATVDPATGVLTTVKKGKAKITATYGEGKYAAKYVITIQVGVTPAMNKKALTIVPGDTPQIDLKNANYLKDTTWTSSDPSIVQVSGWGNLKAISAGTATINATHNGKDYTCAVTVKKPTLSKKKLSLKVGAKKKIKMKNSKLSNVEWTSSDESIVKVDENGQITGVSKGSVEISTTTGGCTDVCVVTVK